MELRARVVEGSDTWYDRYLQKNGQYAFHKTDNRVVGISAPCDQKGFDSLFALGKRLRAVGLCSKFEIAAFDGGFGDWGQMFWICRPDKMNFESDRYTGRFDMVIQEELKAYSSPDFQNDLLEMQYLREYQKKFWDKVAITYSPEAFQKTMVNTILHKDLRIVRNWLDEQGTEPVEDAPYFEFNGMFISNPFYEESLRFEVEPLSYYGVENVLGFIAQVKDVIELEDRGVRGSLDSKIKDAEANRVNGFTEIKSIVCRDGSEKGF